MCQCSAGHRWPSRFTSRDDPLPRVRAGGGPATAMTEIERLARETPRVLTHSRPNIAPPDAARDGFFTVEGLPSYSIYEDNEKGRPLLDAIRAVLGPDINQVTVRTSYNTL